MRTTSSHIGRLLSTFPIALWLMSTPPAGFGQFNSRPASIALVARLESISVVAALPGDFDSLAPGHDSLHRIPALLTTSWTIPSNRTTVRVVENGKSLFSQPTVDSNRPTKRIDQLNAAIYCDRSEEANPEVEQGSVIIFVQAL